MGSSHQGIESTILAIPVSLIGTFFIMYLAGFSINILTLLGIVLSEALEVSVVADVPHNASSVVQTSV